MLDSYGDGWNGASWTWTWTSTGIATTGTLISGIKAPSSGQASFVGSGCFLISVGTGSYPDEISWTVVNDGTGSVVASGGAGESAFVCKGNTNFTILPRRTLFRAPSHTP